MAHIKGSKGGEELSVNQTSENLASSNQAVQALSSKELLLNTYLEKGGYKFHHIPLLGGVLKFFFGNLIAKKAYLGEIQEKFIKNAKTWGLSESFAVGTLGALKHCDLGDLQRIDRFLEAGGLPLFLLSSSVKPLDLIRNVPPESWPALERVVRLENSVSRMIGKTFSPENRKDYIESWLQLAKTLQPDAFNKATANFELFCNNLKDIQNTRPNIYSFDEKDQSHFKMFGDFIDLISAVPFLARLPSELLDRTVAVNPQLLEENVSSFIEKPSSDHRYTPTLNRRTPISYSLSSEFHPDLTIYSDGDEKVDLTNIRTRISITDNKTGETRTLRVPLPITGEMTHTEARQFFRVLAVTINGPQYFSDAYDQEKLPNEQKEQKEQKEQIKKAFTEWADKTTKEISTLIFDFNATENRPMFSFAREDPAVKSSIKNPKNEELALEAAKRQNLFLLSDEKTLSLLPPEIASNHLAISQISSEVLEEVKSALEKGSTPISIALPKEGRTLLVEQQSKKIGAKEYISLAMTIVQGEKKYTREALIPKEDIKRYAKSNLLQRDLLLTKSEFFESTV